jgi:thiamine pyrophosphokinase
MEDETVVVVAGGDPPRRDAALAVPAGAPVIAADGGLEHAVALGLHVATVVGDFDSVHADALSRATAAGTLAVRHPEAKDATDLELALDAALELRPARVLVVSGDGGRLDHLLATLLLLASPRYADVQVDAEVGAASVHVVRRERILRGRPGALVSLLPLHGAAEGVRTEGLEYPLAGERLEPGSSRGVSNVFVGESARVTVEQGVLAAVLPGPEEAVSSWL